MLHRHHRSRRRRLRPRHGAWRRLPCLSCPCCCYLAYIYSTPGRVEKEKGKKIETRRQPMLRKQERETSGKRRSRPSQARWRTLNESRVRAREKEKKKRAERDTNREGESLQHEGKRQPQSAHVVTTACGTSWNFVGSLLGICRAFLFFGFSTSSPSSVFFGSRTSAAQNSAILSVIMRQPAHG